MGGEAIGSLSNNLMYTKWQKDSHTNRKHETTPLHFFLVLFPYLVWKYLSWLSYRVFLACFFSGEYRKGDRVCVWEIEVCVYMRERERERERKCFFDKSSTRQNILNILKMCTQFSKLEYFSVKKWKLDRFNGYAHIIDVYLEKQMGALQATCSSKSYFFVS